MVMSIQKGFYPIVRGLHSSEFSILSNNGQPISCFEGANSLFNQTNQYKEETAWIHGTSTMQGRKNREG